ncbi:MAG TPA: hypothetical protein VMQ93_15810 [Novosphingobium sp.]|nr:hypothetical protein [Novosphingobium sp.]
MMPRLPAWKLAPAGLLLLALGCIDAAEPHQPDCRITAFLGDWVNRERPDEGVLVGKDEVTVVAGMARTPVAYVADRDFGQVSGQVLRQEFPNLARLGSFPATVRQPDQVVCAIHLIRGHRAIALIPDGGKGMVFLEEASPTDPPTALHMQRGRPAPTPAPDLLTPPS